MKQFDKIHDQYTKVRPSYPREVYDEIAADLRAVPVDLAVDIACGSGQSIDGLKRIAKNIIGVDIGPNLLADARKRHPDVTFIQGSGEEPGLEPGIADLVTIATAFYWMDRPKVIGNVSSLLKRHGALAVYKYDFPWLVDPRNRTVERHLAEKWDRHRSPRLKNYDNDTPDLIASSGQFQLVRQRMIENRVWMSVPQYVEFMASTSYLSKFIAEEDGNGSGESTLRQYAFQYAAFARWMQEKHPHIISLRDVTQSIAEEYASSLNHGKFTPSTYNKHLNLLTLVFRVLKNKARLAGNPWEDIQRKRITAQGRRELTIDELRNVCQSAKGELRALLGLGVYSGLRLGDCATLRWGEVDLARNIIRRIPNKTARRNPKPVIVPIHPTLLEMLASPAPEQRAEYVLPEMAALYLRRSDMVTDMVQRHFAACGIKSHKPGTGTNGKRAVVEVGFHSLRHTFVSLCRESNAPLAVVESIVGHSSPAMTRHYTHVGELAAGRAVAMLPSLMGDNAGPVPETKPEGILSKAREMVQNMTAKNWREKRAELLALVGLATE
jgi:integrase/trans-aconitate methyltransferase